MPTLTTTVDLLLLLSSTSLYLDRAGCSIYARALGHAGFEVFRGLGSGFGLRFVMAILPQGSILKLGYIREIRPDKG